MPGLVPGKSLSSTQIISSVLEKSQIYIMLNRMRGLHMHFLPVLGVVLGLTYRSVIWMGDYVSLYVHTSVSTVRCPYVCLYICMSIGTFVHPSVCLYLY